MFPDVHFVRRSGCGTIIKRYNCSICRRKVFINDLSLTLYFLLIMNHSPSSECSIKLKNTSTLPIEFLELTVDTALEPNLQRQIIQWSQKSIQDEIPLAAGFTTNLIFHLFGASNFLAQK